MWKLRYKGSRKKCAYQNHSIRTETMLRSFSFTQVYWSLYGSILREGKNLDTRKGLALHYIALVHMRMKINLAIVFRRADWLTDAFCLPFYYLWLQLLPIWRFVRKSAGGVHQANSPLPIEALTVKQWWMWVLFSCSFVSFCVCAFFTRNREQFKLNRFGIENLVN